MKKLEKIDLAKFQVSKGELDEVKGGMVPASSWDTSYNYHYTYQDNSTTMDQTVYDICRDF